MDNKTTTVKILDKLYINQNLICLIVSFIFLCYTAEQGAHSLINKACYIFFGLSLISVLVSLIFYTCEYCSKKHFLKRCYKLRLEHRQKIAQQGLLPTDKIDSILKCN